MRKPVKESAKKNEPTPPADGLKEVSALSEKQGELTSIKEILEAAVQREESTYQFYMVAQQRACNRVDKELFLRLAQEELLHKQNLLRQLEEVKARLFTDSALSAGEFAEW
jgi:rubrerythrin